MSSNGETSTVLRGVTHGAVDFLIKPVRLEELRNLWQHVWRKRKSVEACKEEGESEGQEASANDHDEKMEQQSANPEASKKRNLEYIASNNHLNRDNLEQGMIRSSSGVLDQSLDEDSSASKKARVVWSVEMHQKFVAAVNQLGIDSESHHPPPCTFTSHSPLVAFRVGAQANPRDHGCGGPHKGKRCQPPSKVPRVPKARPDGIRPQVPAWI